MSFFVVLESIVKGLLVDDVSVCDGNLFTDSVTSELPFNVLKSGINLLTDTNKSPAPACDCRSRSYDCNVDVTFVTEPSSLT